MSQIFDQTFKRTLDVLLANSAPGQSFEAWTFDDAKSRREAEERLKKKGVSARIRSAYKPLLFTFLEEINLGGVDAIEVHYPVHANAPANRFRLEAYPLAALAGDAKIDFIARDDDALHYDVTLSRNGKKETLKVLGRGLRRDRRPGRRLLSRLLGHAGHALCRYTARHALHSLGHHLHRNCWR